MKKLIIIAAALMVAATAVLAGCDSSYDSEKVKEAYENTSSGAVDDTADFDAMDDFDDIGMDF